MTCHKTATYNNDSDNSNKDDNESNACSHGQCGTITHSPGSATCHGILPQPESCDRYRWPHIVAFVHATVPQIIQEHVGGIQHTLCHCLCTVHATVPHQTIYMNYIEVKIPPQYNNDGSEISFRAYQPMMSIRRRLYKSHMNIWSSQT